MVVCLLVVDFGFWFSWWLCFDLYCGYFMVAFVVVYLVFACYVAGPVLVEFSLWCLLFGCLFLLTICVTMVYLVVWCLFVGACLMF